jgi:hypothetical protein
MTRNTKKRVNQTLSDEFEVITGLKQGDTLSPLLFNIALEKIIRNVKNNNLGTNIGATQINILGFADNLNLIGDSMEIVEQNINTLIEGAKLVGLKINQDKTKVMELLPNGEENVVINDYTFEKVKEFKYLGITITNKNDWSTEIISRILKAERAYFALHTFFKSKLFSRRTKIRLYMTTIKPMVTYGCEIWPTTIQLEKKLLVFEYKILRKICGPIFDNELNKWRRRKNTELREITEVPLLTSHIKCQRLKWFGHNMRKTETNNTRAAIEW